MICRCMGTVITGFGSGMLLLDDDETTIVCVCTTFGAGDGGGAAAADEVVSSISMSSSSSNDAASFAYRLAAFDEVVLGAFVGVDAISMLFRLLSSAISTMSIVFDRLAIGSSIVACAFASIFRFVPIKLSPERLNGGSDDFRSSKSASILFAVRTCECLPAIASLPSSSILILPGTNRPSKPANALSDSSWQLGVVGFVPYLWGEKMDTFIYMICCLFQFCVVVLLTH